MRITEVLTESSDICPHCGKNPCECEHVEENLQRGDTLVTDALRLMKGPEVSDAVRALTTVLGNREYNNRRGFYNFYIKQMIDMYKKQGVAEGETWSKHNNPRAGGMSKKSVASYRRSHPGSKIQTAVTTKPSKLKKGSKAAKRRASFCARMRGMKKHRTSAKTARDPNSNINKSLRRWHCESIEQMEQLVMLAEQFIAKNKKL